MATADIKVHTEAHHDDHGHVHEHHGNFWTNYIFRQDHKLIAKQFLLTGMAWALIGGILSVIFRLQLGFPDASLEWLRPVLGGWITPEGKLDSEFYLALVSMQGTIMVSWGTRSTRFWGMGTHRRAAPMGHSGSRPGGHVSRRSGQPTWSG